MRLGKREIQEHWWASHQWHNSDGALVFLFLIKRKVVIGDAEGEDGHGGGVGGAGGLFVGGALGPGAVGALMLEERVAERRIDAVPIFAAQLVGGLGTVVNAVVIKLVTGVGEGMPKE